MRKTLLSLAVLLLAGLNHAFAQRVDVDKKTGLITVDGKPSFYLSGRNRVMFQADYALENLQHQELAYLKALQQPVYSPVTNTTTTETFYNMTFTRSGNSCELHGYTSFSIFKSLAKTIAAARLVQNNDISIQEERKFIMMNNGVFLQDPNGPGGRDGRYAGDGRDGRGGRDMDGRGDRDGRYGDGGYNDRDGRGDRNGRDDRDMDNRDNRGNMGGRDDRDNNYNDRNDDRNNNTEIAGPPAPVNISITNGRIYDGDELIGSYKQAAGKKKGDIVITITDVDNHKLATASRTTAATDWSVTLADGKKVAVRYRADSPLVKLFTFLAEKGYI